VITLKISPEMNILYKESMQQWRSLVSRCVVLWYHWKLYQKWMIFIEKSLSNLGVFRAIGCIISYQWQWHHKRIVLLSIYLPTEVPWDWFVVTHYSSANDITSE
jgi:hypothetical protein